MTTGNDDRGLALEVVGVTKSFGRRRVLDGVDLNVAEGSITAVLGPSGGGKTTLLRIIAGFEVPDDGTVRVGGETMAASGAFVAPERRRVGIVPQEGALFPHLDVAHNIAFGLARGPESARRVGELLELIGLPGIERVRPAELSGGQQQRVALARALAPRPRLVMLDEPFSSLDAGLRAEVRDEVFDALRDAKTTAVLVTHDQQEALSLADQVGVLLDGTIVQAAAPGELYDSPRRLDIATFIGEANVLDAIISEDRWYAICSLGSIRLAAQAPRSGAATVVVRPEHLAIGDADAADAALVRGRVRSRSFFGHDGMVRIDIDGRIILARVDAHSLPRPDSIVTVQVTRSPLVFF